MSLMSALPLPARIIGAPSGSSPPTTGDGTSADNLGLLQGEEAR